jgi:hypothetical protein
MNFFEKNKLVKFTFKLDDGKFLGLTYFLQPNSLREKWINVVKSQRKLGGSYLDLKISNKNYLHIDELVKKINSLIDFINDAYKDSVFVPLDKLKDPSVEKLNELHERFEHYGANQDSLHLGKIIHRRWLNLNAYIHVLETAMETTEEVFPQYSALVTVYPPYPGEKLEEEDKLFLSTDFSWGQLYLGYNTLGKDYVSTCIDNDTRVITNKQVKVQKRYSSEVWLCFQAKSYLQKVSELQFYNWYKTLDSETQKLIPIENLNDLSLGRYYLGCIAVDDELLKFHPVKEDWYFDQNLQKRWNNEVFSRVKSAVNIEFFNL